ncbi:MAG TPA: transglutaminase-like domain-containing protein [Tahibacter sp.]|nr:transglutaminase-like domain-containing protein [Tahibacter sp.]
MRAYLAIALMAAAGLAHAAPREETWMSVTLEGRKIGSMQSVREEKDGRVVTTQTLDVRLDRGGIAIGIATTETVEETPDGKPLAFRSASKLSGIETVADGKVDGDAIAVTSHVGGATQNKTVAWPKDALLVEGLRLLAIRRGVAPGTTYKDLAFQPSSLEAVEVTTRIGRRESVDLPGGRRDLVRVEQDMAVPGLPINAVSWIDDKYNVRKMVMPLLGMKLEMLACDRACATAPNQSTDLLTNALLKAPRDLAPAALESGIRYTLAPRDKTRRIELPTTDEQRVTKKGETIEVTVAAKATASGASKPVAADRTPNAWLQSDAPEIVALAKSATEGAKTDLERMRQLESYVRGYIHDKNLSVGYASALETVKTREGDCTEHALLLAALGRALGIPTRVVDGLAYTSSFGNAQRVFVPPAWTTAWIDGRWQSFDAALDGFDAGHIALGVGDGDPWRFYAGIGTLGNLDLEGVEATGAR